MKMMKSFLLAGGALIASAVFAQAADLPSKKAAVAPPKVNCFQDFWTYMNSSAADCPLTAAGITLYGQIDLGVSYETNASKFDKYAPQVISELIGPTNHGARFQLAPNGLSQSNLGVKWREQIVPDWYFIGDVNFGFNPYALQFANGPRSLVENNLTNAYFRTTNADSSRAYGPINTRAFAGLSNKTLGTLTYGRQYAFSNDNASLYDPMGGAYAFSLFYSTSLSGGLGLTEMARYTNSIKYFYNNNGIRAGALSQLGGWSAGNNAQFAWQATLGFDFQGFSFDGVYSHAKDAVNLSILGNAAFPSLLRATVQNVDAVQLAGKYKWDKYQIMGGWQLAHLTNPSDISAALIVRKFNDGVDAVTGTAAGVGPLAGIAGQGNAYPNAKNLQTAWIGGKYAVMPNLDLAFGYYHAWQNNYNPAAVCTPIANVVVPGVGSVRRYGTTSNQCAGSEDAISGLIDWKPYKRLDVYGGVMYSKVRGGLASGFFADNNLATTAGIRFSF